MSDRDPWEEAFGFSPEEFFDDVERMFEELFGEMQDGESEVWGFSISRRPGEEPEVKRFSGSEQPDYEVSPLVEAYRVEDGVEVMAEVPGLPPREIEVKIGPREVVLSSDSPAFVERVELPVEVDPETLSRDENNGVLLLRLRER